jgi:Helix-turn-helix domain
MLAGLLAGGDLGQAGGDTWLYGNSGDPDQGAGRLGLSPLKFSIVVQLLEYWRDPARRPFPSKRDLADRIGITEKAIQMNMKALEDAGLIRRELRKTTLGDWDTNVYHFDGLLERLRGIEPDFAKERTAKAAWRDARRNAELLPSMRQRRRKTALK